MARLLLGAGADLSRRTRTYTPLMGAVSQVNVKAVQLLLESKKNPRAADGGLEILAWAPLAWRFCYREGAQAIDPDTETPSVTITRLLAQRLGEVDQAGPHGWTALMFAAHHGQVGVVGELQSQKADRFLCTEQGDTARSLAEAQRVETEKQGVQVLSSRLQRVVV